MVFDVLLERVALLALPIEEAAFCLSNPILWYFAHLAVEVVNTIVVDPMLLF